MTDDIVVQLRWISDAKEWVKLRLWETITTEAADEIERLRNRVAEQEITHAVQKKNTMTEIERLRKDLEEMRQVVISEHRRWCDRPCNAEGWNLHD